MVNSRTKKTDGSTAVDDGGRLKRLTFGMALELGEAGGRPFAESLQKAADAAGGEILFMLPTADGVGATGLLRLVDNGDSRLVQVRTGKAGLVISEEPDIDADLLGFARASIDVLERLRADRSVIAPLLSAA